MRIAIRNSIVRASSVAVFKIYILCEPCCAAYPTNVMPRVTNLVTNRTKIKTPPTVRATPTTKPSAEQSKDEVMNVIVYEVVITLVTSKTAAA